MSQTQTCHDIATRADTVRRVYQAMKRFPMVVSMLETIHQSTVPLPGDAEIQHGCQRALTSMLAELSQIPPAAPGDPTAEESTITGWLTTPHACRLMDPDQLERFQNFLDRILSPKPMGA